MKMDFDVAVDDTPQSPNKVIHLSWVGASNSIGDTNTVDTDLINSLVDGKEVDKVGTE